jgi:hypothetical protein
MREKRNDEESLSDPSTGARINDCFEDINNDGYVNGLDVDHIERYWGVTDRSLLWYVPRSRDVHGNTVFAEDADVDGDGVVGGMDISYVGHVWGQTCAKRHIFNEDSWELWCSGVITNFDQSMRDLVPNDENHCCYIKDMLEYRVITCSTGEEDPEEFYPWTFPVRWEAPSSLCGSGHWPLCSTSDPLP